MLLRLLEKRFGAVSAAARQRVATATLADLGTWTDRLLIADSVEAVLAT